MLPLARSRSIRAVQWTARAPRIATIAAASVLISVGLRSLLHTSHEAPAAPPTPAPADARDLRAETFAEAFVRDYLTWDGRRPDEYRRRLDAYRSDASDGLAPRAPRSAAQQVRWTAVAGDVRTSGGARRVTVEAATTRGLRRLTVDIAQTSDGRAFVAGYPALVGSTPTTNEPREAPLEPVDDQALRRVAGRAVRNYLAAAREDLAADLAPGAVVSVPDHQLHLRAIDDVSWTSRGDAVRVVVRAVETDGPEMTLAYELGVVRSAGRWFVRWIQNPEPLSKGALR